MSYARYIIADDDDRRALLAAGEFLKTRTISDLQDGTVARLICDRYGVELQLFMWWLEEILIGNAHPSETFFRALQVTKRFNGNGHISTADLTAIVETIKGMEANHETQSV